MTMKTLYIKIINIAKPVLWVRYAASVHILGEKNELSIQLKKPYDNNKINPKYVEERKLSRFYEIVNKSM